MNALRWRCAAGAIFESLPQLPMVVMYRRLLIIVLTSASVATSAQMASASCGDYLAGYEDAHLGGSQGMMPGSPTAHPPTRVPRPCDGPQCRSKPAIPVPVTPVENSGHEHRQAVAALEEALKAFSHSGRCLTRNERSLSAGYHLRIDRPPETRA